MAEPLFDIVFRGDIILGHNLQDVKQRLGQLFKVDAAKVESLFSGSAVPLKRNLDRATADKYKAVLSQAGAQVQIRPVAPASAKAADASPAAAAASKPEIEPNVQQSPSESPAAVQGDAAFSLAPVGADLLKPSEVQRAPALQLDLSALSLKDMDGNLLEDSEQVSQPAVEVDISAFDLAEPGADLLEGFRTESIPLPEIDPEFDLAEAGADLLDPSERLPSAAVQVDISHLDVLPLDK